MSNDKPLSTEVIQQEVKSLLEELLPPAAQYQHSVVQQWCSQIVEGCTKRILELSSAQRKYITSCVILQNKGVGVHASSACHWDSTTDTSVTVKHENPQLICICTVYSVGM